MEIGQNVEATIKKKNTTSQIAHHLATLLLTQLQSIYATVKFESCHMQHDVSKYLNKKPFFEKKKRIHSYNHNFRAGNLVWKAKTISHTSNVKNHRLYSFLCMRMQKPVSNCTFTPGRYFTILFTVTPHNSPKYP